MAARPTVSLVVIGALLGLGALTSILRPLPTTMEAALPGPEGILGRRRPASEGGGETGASEQGLRPGARGQQW